jgi:ATP-dependent DNA helicase RecG
MILSELQRLMAGEENEGVEFKPSRLSRTEIARYAVGIGNSGGGYLIMGVTNRPPRRVEHLPPLSSEDIQQIRRSVYDSAQIHIQVENLSTPDGNVVVITIPPRPRGQVFHTRRGEYLIRVGEDLRGLTSTEIDAIRSEAGVELTATPIDGSWEQLIRPAGMEDLRALMKEAYAPSDLIDLTDGELLRALGVLAADGRLRLAGLLLVGMSEEIRERLPYAQWQFFRMRSDTDYDQSDGGHDCITVALRRLREHIGDNNPIVTFKGDLVHPEFPRYPVVAVRELLVNAFVHRDYLLPGTVFVKLYPDRLEITTPGGFLGGITPENILHHASVARYEALFSAVTRMRLANAANLGVPRVFREFLSQGKPPPRYWTSGASVRVTLKGQDARPEFYELDKEVPDLDVDELLFLNFLTVNRYITTRQAAVICQRPEVEVDQSLTRLVDQRGLLQAFGSEKGRRWGLSPRAWSYLGSALAYGRERRGDTDEAIQRILSVLGERPLRNAEIRRLTGLDRNQVFALMKKLKKKGLVYLTGRARGSRWHLRTVQSEKR